jgi:imidazolonepropionase-like amidohydrolase
MRAILRAALAATATVFCLPSPGLRAQYESPPPPAAHALTGVTVVQADGGTTGNVTVVVRGGLVETMRPGAEVPADARVLEGEGLVVYPGMVDAVGEAQVDFPEIDRDDVDAWNPPRDVQGFLPHRSVADFLAMDGGDLEDHRQGGIVALAAHAGRGLASGQGAVLLARKTAPEARHLVLRDRIGLNMAFDGSRGGYPATLFAIIAYQRQAFLDAARQARLQAEFARDPRGLGTPLWDPDLEVLTRAAAGELPVFFAADSDEDITRALGLADEFGFAPVIVGGEEAWKKADELARRDVPVLVSVNFERPRGWDPDDTTEVAAPAALRQRADVEAAWANAARLHEAGVTFALTSGGTGELLDGVRTAVENGLDPQAALAAVTATPATLLGVPWLTRIEEGYPATFIVADGELWNEETAIRWTFVDGEVEEGVRGGSAGDAPPAANLTGRWSAEMAAMGQSIPLTITVNQDGGDLSGTMTADVMGSSNISGSISGSDVVLTITNPQLPEPLRLSGSVSADGNSLVLSGDNPMIGSLSVTATREPGLLDLLKGGVR